MARHVRVLAALALAALVAACATSAPATVSLTPPGAPASDLSGTWTGAWGGSPLTLVVTDYDESAPYSGVFVGPFMALGRREPALSGVMTYAARDGRRSVSVQGWVRTVDRRPSLLVYAVSPDGSQELRLTTMGEGQLAGTGSSSFPWGPQGAVTLTRATSGQRP